MKTPLSKNGQKYTRLNAVLKKVGPGILDAMRDDGVDRLDLHLWADDDQIACEIEIDPVEDETTVTVERSGRSS